MTLCAPGKNYDNDGSTFSKEDTGKVMHVIQYGKVSISRLTRQGEGP